MSVRKRTWTTNGVEREAWAVDYVDGIGTRRLKTFKLKRDADKFAATATIEVRDGTHVADAASATIAEAGRLWLTSSSGLERTTTEQYRQHVDLHIVPLIGKVRLNALTAPAVRAFEDEMLKTRSAALTKKVMVSLGSILADSLERGLVARNVVREMSRRRGSSGARTEQRAKGRLKIGTDIPSPADIAGIVKGLQGRWRPLLLTAIFTGMRASELRGLTWDAVDLKAGRIRIYQRADRFKKLGPPKSVAGERTVPLPPIVTNTLKEWRLNGTKSEKQLVFPNLKGEPQAHRHIIAEGYLPAQVRGGVVNPVLDANGRPAVDENGKPMFAPKYSGLHALRHFYASWCINRKSDGGLELPAKVVQERLGHASIKLTLDTYGHLFPSTDDGAELAAAEKLILG